MTTLLISDLHLEADRPELTQLFLDFLATRARRAAALYILGDLFEAWIGDDDDAPLAGDVTAALAALTGAGVATYFVHGNRDFLVGEQFAARTGVELLPEETVVEIGGVRTLLLHGDSLCTDDVAYQQFRAQARNPAWQRGMLAQPLAVRRAFAAQARAESGKHAATASMDIMDVNAGAVRAALARHDVRRMIHGHTHRRAMHAFELGGRRVERIVLGDWHAAGSALRIDGERAEFERV
jgi:UDP-2,3-diacylglucosamine hydrolase